MLFCQQYPTQGVRHWQRWGMKPWEQSRHIREGGRGNASGSCCRQRRAVKVARMAWYGQHFVKLRAGSSEPL